MKIFALVALLAFVGEYLSEFYSPCLLFLATYPNSLLFCFWTNLPPPAIECERCLSVSPFHTGGAAGLYPVAHNTDAVTTAIRTVLATIFGETRSDVDVNTKIPGQCSKEYNLVEFHKERNQGRA